MYVAFVLLVSTSDGLYNAGLLTVQEVLSLTWPRLVFSVKTCLPSFNLPRILRAHCEGKEPVLAAKRRKKWKNGSIHSSPGHWADIPSALLNEISSGGPLPSSL
jgi:hypothetical protein